MKVFIFDLSHISPGCRWAILAHSHKEVQEYLRNSTHGGLRLKLVAVLDSSLQGILYNTLSGEYEEE